MKLKTLIVILLVGMSSSAGAQSDEQALFIKEIYDHTLLNGECYQWLYHLSENIGGRLAGSAAADQALIYTHNIIGQYADEVRYQQCEVPYWDRGAPERVIIMDNRSNILRIEALALGNSIGTGFKGVQGPIIEVQSLDEVRKLGRKNIEGKIVFYNRPMDPAKINTFHAYGGAGDQRVNGPAVAAEYGAIGVAVRSLTTLNDNVPHTGVTRYKEGVPKIPAVAISTAQANQLSQQLINEPLELYIETHCAMIDSTKTSFNVIGEIKGSEYPDEIILVGGHIDSWDVGGGAHDDGAGCVHAIQVFQTLQALNYKPKRTIRCVMFMNEENGLGGGLAYAKESNAKGEHHIAAIESDAGGFTPRGFSCDAEDEVFAKYFKRLTEWENLLEPYDLYLRKGGSGADINPLKSQQGILIGLRPDSQRYFDYHHTANDNINAVNERELKLGAAAMTALVYLIDSYGMNE